jgi:type VI protein secretion system component VasK
MTLNLKRIYLPSIILVGIGGLLFIYVYYGIFIGIIHDLFFQSITLLSLIIGSIGLIVSIWNTICNRRYQQQQQETAQKHLSVLEKQTSIQESILAVSRSKEKQPIYIKSKSERNPWSIVLVLVLIFLFIPLMIGLIWMLFKTKK